MIEVRGYKDSELLNKVKSLPSFKSIPHGWWILGVEANEKGTDNFNDKFYIFYKEECKLVSSGTVNPGVWSLFNFSSYGSTGTAQIKTEEWYYDVWTRGMHKGKVEALVQTGAFKVIRDNNKNNIAGDIEKWSWETGKGLNFHCNSYNLTTTVIKWTIGLWSLGCQVLNNIPTYKKFLSDSKPQKVFSYCLVKEW